MTSNAKTPQWETREIEVKITIAATQGSVITISANYRVVQNIQGSKIWNAIAHVQRYCIAVSTGSVFLCLKFTISTTAKMTQMQTVKVKPRKNVLKILKT